MALSMLAVHEAAENLLNCVCEAVGRLPTEVPGLAGCPCRVGVVPGLPAADGCDGGCDVADGDYPGQLTVNVSRFYASTITGFPAEVTTVRDAINCTLPQVTAVELVVTLWRCAPGASDEGCPPPMDALGATAMQLHADMLATQQGILCCYASTDTTRRKGRRFFVGQTQTLGPQGGCAGFQTRVTVALDDCLPCPAPAPQVAVQGLS